MKDWDVQHNLGLISQQLGLLKSHNSTKRHIKIVIRNFKKTYVRLGMLGTPNQHNVENSNCVNISRYQHKADSFQKASNQQW